MKHVFYATLTAVTDNGSVLATSAIGNAESEEDFYKLAEGESYRAFPRHNHYNHQIQVHSLDEVDVIRLLLRLAPGREEIFLGILAQLSQGE